ncbi:hypothetical protein SAMN04488700_2467 [Carnobacterium iners]|uniref:Uncharacterized protein n=1 Tax=Carnobacterium iners TaxID=1073423 RepID=A0A1X7NTY6_9LACT|nr:gauf-3-monomer [Carnobacterium iners]SEL40083.1 hypothetical protein SAMN04488114_1781 [Carnobacterium iners]SMH41736.1 hypothetical protein SAMN04488700_2459 [Carnobacterium iners]SMH41776.1 hypothetical protein SAMN04488700_2467 [Carnobacterium iners]
MGTRLLERIKRNWTNRKWIVYGAIFAAYVKRDGSLLGVPGVLYFFGICFNWYLYSRLFNKVSKNK